MATNVVDALAAVPMLSGLDRKHLEKLAKEFSERTFPAGRVGRSPGRRPRDRLLRDRRGTATVSVDDAEVGKLGPGTTSAPSR